MEKLVSIILCLAMLLSLSACGNDNAKEPGQVVSAETKEPEAPATVHKADGNYTLSEYLSTGETIWYQLDENDGKDSYVKRVFVLEPDGTMYVTSIVPYTFGELAQMDDVDIVAMVKEEYLNETASKAMGSDEYRADYAWLITYRDQAEASQEIWNKMYYLLQNYALEGQISYEKIMESYGWNIQEKYLLTAIEAEWESIEVALSAWETLYETASEEKRKGIYSLAGSYWGTYDDEMFSQAYQENVLYGVVDAKWDVIPAQEIDDLRAVMKTAVDNVYSNIIAQHEAIKATLEPAQYRISIISDSTGNNTEKMVLAYRIPNPVTEDICSLKLNYQYMAGTQTSNCNTIVYDSTYGGYGLKEGFLYTRVAFAAHLMLDQIGECDLPIDVKDVKTLFN